MGLIRPNLYLTFLNSGGQTQPVALGADGGTDGGVLGGLHDVFYRPGVPDGTFFFTSGTRVYSTSTQGVGGSTTVQTVAGIPSPYSTNYVADALFVQGPNLFFYGTNAAQQGVIFQYTRPDAMPIAGTDGGDAGDSVSAVEGPFTINVENPLTDRPAIVGDATGVYWSDGANIRGLRVGTRDRVQLTPPTGRAHIYALAVSPDFVYWAEIDVIGGTWSLHRILKQY